MYEVDDTADVDDDDLRRKAHGYHPSGWTEGRCLTCNGEADGGRGPTKTFATTCEYWHKPSSVHRERQWSQCRSKNLPAHHPRPSRRSFTPSDSQSILN